MLSYKTEWPHTGYFRYRQLGDQPWNGSGSHLGKIVFLHLNSRHSCVVKKGTRFIIIVPSFTVFIIS